MDRKVLSKILTAALLLSAVVSVAACNTVAGAGQDTSAAGHALTNSAEQAKHNM